MAYDDAWPAHAAAAPELLATKLTVPPPPAGLVARPRLTARLDEASRRRLALIVSPPGFGKTTLLSAWLSHCDLAAAWVALDERDDDAARFWSYVLAALERAAPGCTGRAVALLRSLEASPDTVLTALVNGLAASPRPLLLALDDLHHVSDEALLRGLARLVEHAPPQLHLLIASRRRPSLPLSRLRARGQLLELTASDLRFSEEEAAAFLADAMGIALAPSQVAALSARAEGWIAGLQLAALALRGRSEGEMIGSELSGDNRYIAEYLSDEVIERQPADLQAFLLRAAVLERLCAPLCAAVTGQPEAAVMLRRIEEANLFLQPLDDLGEWYRFHTLFAEALRRKLRQTAPELVVALHQRASAWHEQTSLH